ALDDDDPGRAEADHLVLGRLDGRHDVAHAVAASGVDRRQQGRVGPGLRSRLRSRAEPFVGEIDDGTTTGTEMAPEGNTLRIGSRRGVEWARHGCSPVGQQCADTARLAPLRGLSAVGRGPDVLAQTDLADVYGTVLLRVDPAEAQTIVG